MKWLFCMVVVLFAVGCDSIFDFGRSQPDALIATVNGETIRFAAKASHSGEGVKLNGVFCSADPSGRNLSISFSIPDPKADTYQIPVTSQAGFIEFYIHDVQHDVLYATYRPVPTSDATVTITRLDRPKGRLQGSFKGDFVVELPSENVHPHVKDTLRIRGGSFDLTLDEVDANRWTSEVPCIGGG